MIGKRVFDIVCAGAGLLVLAPFFCLLAVLIKLDSKGAVFFRQLRVGRDGRAFRIFKFRTMVQNAEMLGGQITAGDDCRVTRVGRCLRKWKLDELPQLLNVLHGEMSLVGPRPEVPKYVEKFRMDFNEILRMRPGITDLSSLTFRNESELLKNVEDPEAFYIGSILPQKILLAKEYAKRASLSFDFRLIMATIFHGGMRSDAADSARSSLENSREGRKP